MDAIFKAHPFNPWIDTSERVNSVGDERHCRQMPRQKITCHDKALDYGDDMPILLTLKKRSRLEKLRAMESLWTDLSQDDAAFKSPAWHEEALRETERAVAAGTAKFSDWEEAKKRLRRRAAKPA